MGNSLRKKREAHLPFFCPDRLSRLNRHQCLMLPPSPSPPCPCNRAYPRASEHGGKGGVAPWLGRPLPEVQSRRRVCGACATGLYFGVVWDVPWQYYFKSFNAFQRGSISSFSSGPSSFDDPDASPEVSEYAVK